MEVDLRLLKIVTSGPFQPMDFATTYLKGVLSFFGFETELFSVEGSTVSTKVLESTKAVVLEKIRETVSEK